MRVQRAGVQSAAGLVGILAVLVAIHVVRTYLLPQPSMKN